jgi:replicative DNA helicase
MSDVRWEDIRNVPAERQVLGSLMIQPALADRVFSIVTPDDFGLTVHVEIALLIQRLHLSGEALNPTGVMTAARNEGILGKIGGGPYLFELVQQVEVAMTAPRLAEEIHRCATRRAMCVLAARLEQKAANPEAEPVTILTEVGAQIADLHEAELTTSTVEVASLRQFLDQTDDEVDWVIPGLLAREDRLILTGAEGAGKMMMLRQLAICAAAGLHPFTHRPVPRMTVLLIDLENPAAEMRRTMRWMVRSAQLQSQLTDITDRIYVERRPEGIDLANPANIAWLMKRVTVTQPDLLIIGPLYKAMNDNPNDEQVARRVAAAFDLVRTQGHCALMIEAHSGHESAAMTDRPIRPIGSSLWRRWPEFGYGLRYAKTDDAEDRRRMEFVSWRGARGERDWPMHLIGDPRYAFQIAVEGDQEVA